MILILRSVLFNVAFFTTTAIFLIAGLPVLAAGRTGVFRLARAWSRTSLWLLDKICGAKVEFRGIERIPPGPVLLAAKHQSALETFALVHHIPDFSFILKRELLRLPLFGWYLRRAEQIAIDRTSGRAALDEVVMRAKALLAEGRSVFIFPEGTRRAVGAPPSYKMGVAHIYDATGATCLPVALNTGICWPRRSFVKRPGLIVIEYLEPIPPGLSRKEFASKLQDVIETRSNQLAATARIH
jgi:1-acyl-sn-glycerol-3-phosphate acyltransferase